MSRQDVLKSALANPQFLLVQFTFAPPPKLLLPKILVRYFSEPPRLADCLRISIGTDAETDALLSALTELLA